MTTDKGCRGRRRWQWRRYRRSQRCPAPKPTYVPPEDHQAPRGLTSGLPNWKPKFDEGDIQRAEYAAENRKLMREQADLDREQMRADTALDTYQTRVSAMWKDAF